MNDNPARTDDAAPETQLVTQSNIRLHRVAVLEPAEGSGIAKLQIVWEEGSYALQRGQAVADNELAAWAWSGQRSVNYTVAIEPEVWKSLSESPRDKWNPDAIQQLALAAILDYYR